MNEETAQAPEGLIDQLASIADAILPSILVRYGDDLLDGLWITVQLVVIATVVGAVVAALVTAVRLSEPPRPRTLLGRVVKVPLYYALRALMVFYVALFRGTPLLAQLFLIYYGAGQFFQFWQGIGLWWFLREPFNCAVLAFVLNTAAYQAEIFRGAVQAVPAGQWEGAAALGIGKRTAFRKVVMPQAALYALRPFGNDIILTIKGSAVASVVTVYDLLGETRLAYSDTFRFEVYFYAAAMYLIIVEVLRRVWNLLERRLTRHLDDTVKAKAVTSQEFAA